MKGVRLMVTVLLSLTLSGVFLGAADITVNISQPASGAKASEKLFVQASVTSLYELSSVTAAVQGRQTNLVFSSAASAWTNTILLLGLARGQTTLTVTAQDVFGNSAQTQRV